MKPSLALITVIAILLFTPQLPAQLIEQPRTVSTTGESIVRVAPDQVIVGVGVESFHPNLQEVKAMNDAACKKLLAAIKDLKIEDKDIQTDVLQVDIRYKRSDHPADGIEGYFARRQYSVTLKDVKLLEKLVETSLQNGANQLLGITYETKELRKHRDEARKMAIKAAREKAEALVKELCGTLGSPRTITEGYSNFGGYYRYGGNSWANSNAQVQMEAPAGGGGEEEGATPLGQMTVRASISVTFDLLPGGGATPESKPAAAEK